MKIVSGAQTGVDRAALDAAMASGIEAGGWCPQGRLAEDGVIPDLYPVTELPGAGYRQRTRQNVIDSDGTLIIYFVTLSGGTKQTWLDCQQANKPCLRIDGQASSVAQATEQLDDFIRKNAISTLNVAGPRASGESRAYEYTKCVLYRLFQKSN